MITALPVTKSAPSTATPAGQQSPSKTTRSAIKDRAPCLLSSHQLPIVIFARRNNRKRRRRAGYRKHNLARVRQRILQGIRRQPRPRREKRRQRNHRRLLSVEHRQYSVLQFIVPIVRRNHSRHITSKHTMLRLNAHDRRCNLSEVFKIACLVRFARCIPLPVPISLCIDRHLCELDRCSQISSDECILQGIQQTREPSDRRKRRRWQIKRLHRVCRRRGLSNQRTQQVCMRNLLAQSSPKVTHISSVTARHICRTSARSREIGIRDDRPSQTVVVKRRRQILCNQRCRKDLLRGIATQVVEIVIVRVRAKRRTRKKCSRSRRQSEQSSTSNEGTTWQ